MLYAEFTGTAMVIYMHVFNLVKPQYFLTTALGRLLRVRHVQPPHRSAS